jgi:GNAT superfamily N-acetyltransferase
MADLRVRLALPEDRERILAISAKIWAGQDYIPHVLDRWLSEGGLFVAELSGKVVGFAKNTELSPGEIWLEGLRVDPEHQRKGVAKALARAQLEAALAKKPHSVRLATVEENLASLHIAQELGFREIARFSYLEADVVEPKSLPQAEKPESKEAWDFLQHSSAFSEARGLVGLGWRFRTLTFDFLTELCNEGNVFAPGKDLSALLIVFPDPYTPEEILALAFLDGEELALEKLLHLAHGLAVKRGNRILSAMVADPWLYTFLSRRGFQGVPELGAVVVLEYG